MGAQAKRLLIPAVRRPQRETLRLGLPWFLRYDKDAEETRAIENAPPALLTFTKDEFIPNFFAGAEDPAAGFEPLERYRDYSEPPDAMLDIHGAPLYPAGEIKRQPPGAQALAPYDPDSPSELDPLDGVPRAESGGPAWLRKLYLPLHRHFHVVSLEVVCDRLGFPRLGAERILEAGLVVRRLAARKDRQGWEDWISADGEIGLWLEIADQDMAPPATPGAPLDPRAIAQAIPAGEEALLRSRLGLTEDDSLPNTLTVERMSPVPAKIGEAAKHSAFFGYLPLQSASLQAPNVDPAVTEVDAIAALLSARAASHLEGEFLNNRPEDPATLTEQEAFIRQLPSVIKTPLEDLVTLLVLPNAGGGSRATIGASGDLATRPNDWGDDLDRALDFTLMRVLSELWSRYNDGLTDTAEQFWSAQIENQLLGWLHNHQDYGEISTWVQDAIDAEESTFKALVRDHFHTIASQLWRSPGSAPIWSGRYSGGNYTRPFSETHLDILILVTLQRLRAHRKRLADDINGHVLEAESLPELNDKERVTLSCLGTTLRNVEVPQVTVARLAGEIEAWLGADAAQKAGKIAYEWPPLPPEITGSSEAQAHALGIKLEARMADFEEAGTGAGSAYAEQMAALASATCDSLVAELNRDPIGGTAADLDNHPRREGLSFDEQPLRGLLLQPGYLPTRANVQSFIDDVAALYGPAPAPESEEAKRGATELEALKKLVRPRYDSDSLYAVWCFLRIAGKDPCEEERVVWTARSDVFSIAETSDILGLRPVALQLPDVNKLIRSIPRIPKARANPFAAVLAPPDSDYAVGEEMGDTARQFGIAWICSFGIPVFTICAWILFKIILSILLMIPGFGWLLLLKFCIPIPTKK